MNKNLDTLRYFVLSSRPSSERTSYYGIIFDNYLQQFEEKLTSLITENPKTASHDFFTLPILDIDFKEKTVKVAEKMKSWGKYDTSSIQKLSQINDCRHLYKFFENKYPGELIEPILSAFEELGFQFMFLKDDYSCFKIYPILDCTHK